MDRIFLLAGVSIIGLLGLLHLILTFYGNRLEPKTAATKKLMQQSQLVLTSENNIYNAWVGFNASHSLGAMLLAGVYLPIGLNHYHWLQQSLWLSSLPLLVCIGYLVLAKRYWFSRPLWAIGLAVVFLLAYFVLSRI